MNRSSVRAAAISWIVACGLFYGGAGTLAAAPAAAAPDTVHNGPDGADTAGDAPSNTPRTGGHRQRGQGSRPGSDTTAAPGAGRPGSHRLPRAAHYPGPPSAPSDDEPGDDEPGDGDTEHPTEPGDETPGYPESPGDPAFPNWPAHWPHDGPENWPGHEPGDWPENWPWPWPWPPCDGDPGDDDGVVGTPGPRVGIARPPESAGGGSGGGIGFPPVTVPSVPGVPSEPTPVNVEGGAAPPAATGEPATLEMPPVIGLPPVFEAPLRPVGTPSGAGPAESGPGARGNPAREPNSKAERIPASAGTGTEPLPSFRVGYPEYLRDAKIGEIAALALPGFAGLLALTALGGVVGYRQARAGHGVRAAGTARFLR